MDSKKQYAQIERWKKQNMKKLTFTFKKDFVEEYKQACAKLGISQSDPIRQAIEETIRKGKQYDNNNR